MTAQFLLPACKKISNATGISVKRLTILKKESSRRRRLLIWEGAAPANSAFVEGSGSRLFCACAAAYVRRKDGFEMGPARFIGESMSVCGRKLLLTV